MTDAEKRAKVINGLECCISGVTCEDCPYALPEDGTCETLDWMLIDALELLELQEPADVVERPREFVCPKCGLRLAGRSTDDCVQLETDETPNFCWRCGQAVKWE